ncbi:MAG TPA: DUF2807 domain-containing protein [Pseudonocardiaceae bacterium]|nr:DUF2807 domain-containing protein [Pseudonocardiaceae bacterium]
MRTGPDGSVQGWTARVARAVVTLATTALLAGCLGTSADGGSGGNGGDGYGGWGGNGYGGNGGNADGRAGADGAAGAAGGGFTDPAAVAGSGRLTSRTIDLSGVTSVVAEADFVVHLRAGGPAQAVVTMDDNLVDRVDASVTGDELHLGIKPGRGVRNATLSAEVTVGRLDRLATSAASRVVLTSTITSPALQMVVSGAGSVTGPIQIGQVEADVSGTGTLGLSGHVSDLHLRAAGASRLPLADLTVRHLDATLSGASHVVVTVSDTLAVQATGASMLRYRGTPEITRSQRSGASSVVPESR